MSNTSRRADKNEALMDAISDSIHNGQMTQAGEQVARYGVRMFILDYYQYARETMNREDANRLYRDALGCWARYKKEYEQPDLFKKE